MRKENAADWRRIENCGDAEQYTAMKRLARGVKVPLEVSANA